MKLLPKFTLPLLPCKFSVKLNLRTTSLCRLAWMFISLKWLYIFSLLKLEESLMLPYLVFLRNIKQNPLCWVAHPLYRIYSDLISFLSDALILANMKNAFPVITRIYETAEHVGNKWELSIILECPHWLPFTDKDTVTVESHDHGECLQIRIRQLMIGKQCLIRGHCLFVVLHLISFADPSCSIRQAAGNSVLYLKVKHEQLT